jgi:hypothetical protein
VVRLVLKNIKRVSYIAATTPVVLLGSAAAASATDPTTTKEAIDQGLGAAQVGALAVGLSATVIGLALFAAPEAVRFGKKMYAKSRA